MTRLGLAIAAALWLGLCAMAPAGPEHGARAITPALRPGDRISGLTVRLIGGETTGVRGVPSDWIVTIDNDVASQDGRPPGGAGIEAHAVHGVAFLEPTELARFEILFAARERPHLTGEATIANPAQPDRTVKLTFRQR